MLNRLVFLAGLLVSASSFVSPPIALTMGLIFGLAFEHPYPKETAKFSRWLLQASVVGLGFGMNLHEVVRAGRSGFCTRYWESPLRCWRGWRLGDC